MQCPDCAYEVNDTAIFCPRCRFQFRETDTPPVVPGTTIPDTPGHDAKSDESFFEETQKAFSGKELRMLEIQLLQPAILVVLVISLCMYTVISTVPFIPEFLKEIPVPVTARAGVKNIGGPERFYPVDSFSGIIKERVLLQHAEPYNV